MALAGRLGLIGGLTKALTGEKVVFAYSLAGLFMGYVYFSMAFALLVEVLNIRSRRPSAPLQLHEVSVPGEGRQPAAG